MMMNCENCGNQNMAHGGTWEGRPVCYECRNQGFLLADEQTKKRHADAGIAHAKARGEANLFRSMTLEELEAQVARTQGRGDGSGSIPLHLFLSLREGTDEAWDWANLAPTPGVSRRDALKLELGDLLNVITAIVMHAGFTLEEVAKANDDELRQRWPDGHPDLKGVS